jgi:hypothetical protein
MNIKKIYNDNKILVWISGIGSVLLIIGLINRKKINEMLTEYNNKAKFDTLNPAAKPIFKKFFMLVKQSGWNPIITSAWRSYAREVSIIAAEKLKMSANNSPHLYSLACDCNFENQKTGKRLRMADGVQSWLDSGIPQIAEKLGLRWGGRFNGYPDVVHFDIVNILANKGIKQTSLYDKALAQFGGDPNKIVGSEFVIKA